MLYIKAMFVIEVCKSRLGNCDRPARGESASRRRFWRVLALEEFTDVQCVIVDHPMPSLAGYRIIEGSSFEQHSKFPI